MDSEQLVEFQKTVRTLTNALKKVTLDEKALQKYASRELEEREKEEKIQLKEQYRFTEEDFEDWIYPVTSLEAEEYVSAYDGDDYGASSYLYDQDPELREKIDKLFDNLKASLTDLVKPFLQEPLEGAKKKSRRRLPPRSWFQ